MGRPGTFSVDMQPIKRRGKARYSKLVDALKAKGYSEQLLYEKIVEIALGEGDVTLLKEIMTRFCPPSKPSAQDITFDFPEAGTAVQKIDSVIAGVAAGDIPADIAKLVVDMIKTSLDVEEVTELAQRLERIESIISDMSKV